MDYTREGIEMLAAAVLESVYKELIEARIADAAHEFNGKGYNATMYYEMLKQGKRKYGSSKLSSKIIKAEIEECESWFRSWKCKVYCINASGEWFIRAAKKQACAFAQDKIPVWEAKPNTRGGDDRNRDNAEWKRKRDEWREKHNLVEVE